jgi:hypothetical protein
MNIRNIIMTASLLLAVGCGGNRKAEQFKALPFPDAVPPAMMESADDRAEYMLTHWWDGITDPERNYPCDSTFVSGVSRDVVEQKFANWVNILDMMDMRAVEKAVVRLYDRVAACERKDTASNVFETLSDLVVKYLYDPNSPLRNEDHYAFFAARMASSDLVAPELQQKYAREVRLASLNRVGTKAADFRFLDKRGKAHTLYGTDAEYTLLFFSNPGCTACQAIMDELNMNPNISRLIDQSTMAVINIYIDEDLAAWRDYASAYSDKWYNGFDPDLVIRGETLYNVRAIPSLYLLDRDKTVLMKDAPEGRLFERLSRIK